MPVLTGFTGGNDREELLHQAKRPPGDLGRLPVPRYRLPDLQAVYLPALPGYSQGLPPRGPYSGYLGRQYDPLRRLRPREPHLPSSTRINRSTIPSPPYGGLPAPLALSQNPLTVDDSRRENCCSARSTGNSRASNNRRDLATMDRTAQAIEL